jgi:hypothetical protein
MIPLEILKRLPNPKVSKLVYRKACGICTTHEFRLEKNTIRQLSNDARA